MILFEDTTNNDCGSPKTAAEAEQLGYTTTVPSDYSPSTYCLVIKGGKAYYKKRGSSSTVVTPGCGNPTTALEAEQLGYTTTVPSDYSQDKYCFKILGGKSYYKRKDGTVTPPPVQGDLQIFVGQYRGEEFLKDFEILLEDGNLNLKATFGKTKLTKVSDNNFTGKILGQDYDIKFNVTNNQVQGGKIVYSLAGIIKEINFTKIVGGLTPPPEGEGTWEEVTRKAWEALKKAGYEVKEYAGKLWALIGPNSEPVKQDIWTCIYKFLEKNHYDNLNAPVGADHRFLYRREGNEKYTEKYYRDYTVKRFRTGTENVIRTGKWGCGTEDDTWYIKWNDGETEEHGGQLGQSIVPTGGQQGGGSNSQSGGGLKSFSEACSKVLKCPTVEQVQKGRAYKVCMKCPEIKKLQETILFNKYYSDRLKENGKNVTTDEYFGPIMKQAVLDYQTVKGIKGKSGTPTGMIGPQTYNQMMNDKAPEPTPTPSPVVGSSSDNKQNVSQQQNINKATAETEF